MRKGHGKVVVIQQTLQRKAHVKEITHTLRRGQGKVIDINIAAGTSWHKITHTLRRGHDRVVVSILAGSTCDEITRVPLHVRKLQLYLC